MADTKVTHSVGVDWTCATLGRHGWATTLTPDMDRADILAVDPLANHPPVQIQVKTTISESRPASWPLGEQALLPDRSGREWFVLVAVPTLPDPPRAFVIPRDHAAAAAWVVHLHWLTDPSVPAGRRNAPVSQARIKVDAFEGYEDRWDLLTVNAREVPVLLPPQIRQWSQEGIGLPPGHPWHQEMPFW